MHLYDLHDYGDMIGDGIRTAAYARALGRRVTSESVVVDMGTGVGILAMLACQCGARKVYAVDPNDVIQVAREIAAANGYLDRIEFIQDMSTRITPAEKADVVVAEMHGVLPMFERNLASMIDARRRLLAPDGTMIPERETLWAVPIDAPDAYEAFARPWKDNAYGLDMRAAMRRTTNGWRRLKSKVSPEQFLAEPACWATLDYRVLESANVDGVATWTASRAGTAHGVLVWFDTFLAEGISFSNSPAAAQLIFGQAFFPLPEPVSISLHDQMKVAIRADLVGDNYVWSWETVVLEHERAQHEKARFNQSTFLSMAASPATLRKRAGDHVPRLSDDGHIRRFALTLMNGERSLEEAAREVSTRFPHRFPSGDDALTLVADLSEQYGE